MNETLDRVEVAKGAYINFIRDGKFKTLSISFNFLQPLSRDTATSNALIMSVLRRGSSSYESLRELNRALDNLYGASLSAGASRLGESQVLSMTISTISSKYADQNENVERECAALLLDQIYSPSITEQSFNNADVDIEKNSLKELILAAINDKRNYSISRLEQSMCEGEPYGVSKYGYVEDLEDITGVTLYETYKNVVNTSPIEIVVTGNFDREDILSEIKNTFSDMHRSGGEKTTEIAAKTRSNVNEVSEKTEVAQSKMCLGFNTDVSTGSLNLAGYKVAVALYGGTPRSKLFLNVRERLSLCYYCAARIDVLKGIMIVDCGVENENIKAARAEILAQLELIKNGNFTDDELEDIKLALYNSYKSVPDSLSNTSAWYLREIYMGTYSDPETEAQRVMAVTSEDVVLAAETFMLNTVYLLTGGEVNFE